MASTGMASDDDLSREGSPAPQDLFSDSDDDGGGAHSGSGRRVIRSDDEDQDGDRGGARDAQTRDGDRNTDDEAEEERKKEEKRKKDEQKKKKPKGPVRRQMISEDMLTGKNGLSKLPDIFKDFKFGGKGREKQDLSNILSKVEHWVHMLHPKQPFDQSLQRIEYLGLKKKIVKVHLKKIRMGMVENVVDEEDDNARLLQDLNEEMEAAAQGEFGGHDREEAGPSDQIPQFTDDDLRELEEMEAAASAAVETNGNREGTQRSQILQFTEDDIDELEEMEAAATAPAATFERSQQRTGTIQFTEDDLHELEEMEVEAQTDTAVPKTHPNASEENRSQPATSQSPEHNSSDLAEIEAAVEEAILRREEEDETIRIENTPTPKPQEVLLGQEDIGSVVENAATATIQLEETQVNQ